MNPPGIHDEVVAATIVDAEKARRGEGNQSHRKENQVSYGWEGDEFRRL